MSGFDKRTQLLKKKIAEEAGMWPEPQEHVNLTTGSEIAHTVITVVKISKPGIPKFECGFLQNVWEGPCWNY